MAKFPTYEEMAKKVAEEALDGYIYKGKTLREWVDILAQTQWIPVETALPEEGVSVLVYAERNAYGDNGKYRKKVIDIGWQVDGHWHIDGCNGVVGIMWMPIPTPPNMSEIPTGVEVRENE